MPREHTIFDLLGLTQRVGRNPIHDVMVTYQSHNDQWSVHVLDPEALESIYYVQIVDSEPSREHGDRTIEQAYNELQEYLS